MAIFNLTASLFESFNNVESRPSVTIENECDSPHHPFIEDIDSPVSMHSAYSNTLVTPNQPIVCTSPPPLKRKRVMCEYTQGCSRIAKELFPPAAKRMADTTYTTFKVGSLLYAHLTNK